MIELERDSNLYPNGNFVEWHKSANQADVDGFEIKRHGDENVKVKVILHVDNSPERFKLSPELADVLAIDVETRPGIMMALWQYIKFHQLQDPEDKRNINCDQKLATVRHHICLVPGESHQFCIHSPMPQHVHSLPLPPYSISPLAFRPTQDLFPSTARIDRTVLVASRPNCAGIYRSGGQALSPLFTLLRSGRGAGRPYIQEQDQQPALVNILERRQQHPPKTDSRPGRADHAVHSEHAKL